MPASSNEPSGKQVMLQFVYLAVSLVGSGFLMKWATTQLDPNRENKKKAQRFKKGLQRRLGMTIETDSYEEIIAMDIINPNSIDVTLDDVGGHEETKKILDMKVILPLRQPEMFNSYLLRQPKGVLLYGPPGTGKTMLAKALAKASNARFINIKASSLQSKWFGETQKLVQAVFTLAHKLQPTIIFIDEVDALLGKRREQEHEAITTMKTEIMQLWDGFSTDDSAKIMILAATNRPYDLDDAVLRRFTLQLEVPLPDAFQREAILKLILKRQARGRAASDSGVHPDLLENAAGVEGRRPLAKIAEQTDGYNGSDLLEFCSRAAAVPLQECYTRSQQAQANGSSSSISTPRKVEMKDLQKVLRTFKPATQAAEEYRQQTNPGRQLSTAELQQVLAQAFALGVRA